MMHQRAGEAYAPLPHPTATECRHTPEKAKPSSHNKTCDKSCHGTSHLHRVHLFQGTETHLDDVLGFFASLEYTGLCQITQHHWNTPASPTCGYIDCKKFYKCLSLCSISSPLASNMELSKKSELKMSISMPSTP